MFEIEKAERVQRFIESYCSYTVGTEFAGKPFRLLPWQRDKVVYPFFGTVNDNGLRQYRICYIEIPKKNGKTELISALSNYFLGADNEKGAEVYVAASTREQAGLTYKAAATMVRNSEDLSRRYKCVDSRKRIVYLKTNSFIQILSSDTKAHHGLNPSAVIIDEIHAHPNSELWETLTAGTDYARSQQAVFVITTAGIYNRNSIWWKLRTRAQQVEAGIIEDPRFLPVLYLADPEKDDPEDEALWARVNPSLGQIFTIDKIRQDFAEAKKDPVDYQNFLRFRLNIPIRQLIKWMPMDKWDKCNKPVDHESLKGRKCYGGLDLSQKIDLSAFVVLFEPGDDGIWDVLMKFYCPEERIIERSTRDKVNYDIWRKQGFITATPGETVDYAYIEKDIIEMVKEYEILEVGFDPWKATSTCNRLMEELNPDYDVEGFQMVEVRQGGRSLHEPGQDLLVNVLKEKIRHGGNPVMRWNMDNLVMRMDPNENMAPDKQKSIERIDGAVALIIAWSRAIFADDKEELTDSSCIII